GGQVFTGSHAPALLDAAPFETRSRVLQAARGSVRFVLGLWAQCFVLSTLCCSECRCVVVVSLIRTKNKVPKTKAPSVQRPEMYFKQFYLGCLAHASYLIGSNGEAVVVDPQRDVDEYIDEASTQHLKIKYIIETHRHADFVSGHRELAVRTGAEIVFGRQAGVEFTHRSVNDGDELKIGSVVLKFMETPGHTPESICVLVRDTQALDSPQKVLTGDTLFIGDVGRPDLAGGKGYTPQMM